MIKKMTKEELEDRRKDGIHLKFCLGSEQLPLGRCCLNLSLLCDWEQRAQAEDSH